jgi:hypothetical protein
MPDALTSGLADIADLGTKQPDEQANAENLGFFWYPARGGE